MVEDAVKVANQLTLTETSLDYPGGPSVIKGSLKVEDGGRRGGRSEGGRCDHRKESQTCNIAGCEMEKGGHRPRDAGGL